MAGVVRSLDPAAPPADAAEAWTKSRVTPLAFETLATIDPDGELQPWLAVAWESSADTARWRFRIRRGVLVHDGSTLQGWQVAASMRTNNPSWTVDADGDVVIVAPDHVMSDLPWELARARQAIVVRGSSGELLGTGPFRIDRVDARRIGLRVYDRYWAARPFLDAVQIEMGRTPSDQLVSIQRGGADLVSARPTDAPRLIQSGLRMMASRPLELVALVFEPHRATADHAEVRTALSYAIDRGALCTILLQQHAQPAGMLLPRWLSGYAPLSATVPMPQWRTAVAALPVAQRTLTIRVEPGDAVVQAIADRVVVDAREMGLSVAVQAPSGLAPRPDARIVRVPLEASTPDRALAGAMSVLGARATSLAGAQGPPAAGAGPDVVYRIEHALLEHHVIVPLVYLPDLYAVGDRVRVWKGSAVLPSGALNLASVWIE